MRTRIMFETPHTRAAFIGNEIENTVTFDVESGKVRGFFGSFTELPADPTQQAERHTSEPFEVQLTAADLQQIATIILTRAGEQGVGGMAPTSIVRID